MKTAQEAPTTTYWPMFEHMSENHGLTLVDSEMEDIIQVADKILARRSKDSVDGIYQNLQAIKVQLRTMRSTLQQIANSKNDTAARRNARATLAFLETQMKENAR